MQETREQMAVAKAFQTLWHSLTTSADGPRPQDEWRVLVDAVRDALDRGELRLGSTTAGVRTLAGLEVGAIVANTFVVRQILSTGPHNLVCRASHRDLKKDFVLKTLMPEHASSPVLKAMMMREACHHMGFSHPVVVPVRTMLRLADGRPCLISDFVPGPTLAERARAGPLDAEAIVSLATGVLDGLASIHAAGLVHADLSADNVILADGQASAPRILDLGAALPIGQRHDQHDVAFIGRAQHARDLPVSGPLAPATDLQALRRMLERVAAASPAATREDPGLRELTEMLVAARHAGPGANPAAEIRNAVLAKHPRGVASAA